MGELVGEMNMVVRLFYGISHMRGYLCEFFVYAGLVL